MSEELKRKIVSFQLVDEEVDRFEELERRAKTKNKLSNRNALLRELIGLDNYDLLTREDRAYFLQGSRLAVFEPNDTPVPALRAVDAVSQYSNETKMCPTCRHETSGAVCAHCGRPQADAEYLSKVDLDNLPYGVIKLYVDGTILEYNKAERELSHIFDKKMQGKNFFKEVAKCAKVRVFKNRFKKFLAGNKDSEEFDFVYKFPHEITHVNIVFLKESEDIGYVVATRRKARSEEDIA